MSAKRTVKPQASPTVDPVQRDINTFSQYYPEKKSRLLMYCGYVLLLFAMIGFIWSAPFPYLGFLKAYNGFINWASFFIALVVYYYYRRRPLASYGVLLVVFASSYFIVSIERWRDSGEGMQIWQVCSVVFVLAVILLIVAIRGRKKGTATFSVAELLVTPLVMFDFPKRAD